VTVPTVAIIAGVLAAFLWGVKKKSRSSRHIVPAGEAAGPPGDKPPSLRGMKPGVACKWHRV
jgi:hypothetical protein